MTHYVVVKKLKEAAKKDLAKVTEWQNEYDKWLQAHGAKFESVKHYLTAIGAEIYESWYVYPDVGALDADGDLSYQWADNSEWKRLNAKSQEYFERVSSRIVRQI